MNNTIDQKKSIWGINQIMTVSIKSLLVMMYPAECMSVETVVWFIKEKMKGFVVLRQKVQYADNGIA